MLKKFSNTPHAIEINQGLAASECMELFSKILDIPIDALPEEAMDLHRMCSENPFVISLVAINLKRYQSNSNRWKYWKKELEQKR